MGSASCGGIDLLADTFNAIAASPQWYTYENGGSTVAQTGGEAVITLPATTTATSNYSGYESVLRYDARGQRLAIEVPKTTSTGTTAQTDIQLISPAGDLVSITEEGGQLTAGQYIGGMRTNFATIPYDPVAQRWWAFRESAGTLFYETSPDGVAFTSFQSISSPTLLARVSFVAEAGTFQSVNNGGAAHFDNVNGGTATGTFCAASTLHDDFNSGVIGDQWAGAYTSGPCTYQEASGELTVSLTAAGSEECAIQSANAYDLTNDAVFAELVAAPGLAQTYAMLRARAPGAGVVEVAVSGSLLQCGVLMGSNYTTNCSLTYDPVAHRFLRLRGAGGMLAWETSPDGATWTTQAMAAPPIPLGEVMLSVGAGTNGAPATPSGAKFGTFDVLPP